MSTQGTITREPPAAPLEESMVRDLPEPEGLRRLIGPSVILVGVGVASGEYILFPFIASKAGLAFLWAAIAGVAMQFFINMEIERYTLATGQTALTGFTRLWKPWSLVLVFLALLATLWPGWATSAATITTFAVGGGDVNTIAIAGLLAIGVALTSSPVVYQTVERLELLKVGALLVFVVIALFAAVSGTAYRDTTEVATSFGTFPGEIELAILVGALAAAGAGGANNLVQSNWIRDKGFGMGRYAPRIVSPITGEEEAALSGQRYEFPEDEANLSRWREWWKKANLEQFVSFALVAAVSITAFSLIAYSTVYGNPDLPESSDFSFISLEADVLDDKVGSWFGTLFLAIGAISLFAAALGIVDYVSRLVADAVRCGYTEGSERWTESRLYFITVWTMVIVGSSILLAGFDQPLVLVTISTVLGGFIMFVYSSLLVVTNRRYLPKSLQLGGYRLVIMGISIVVLGATSVIVGIDQFGNLL
ncbi:MAG TPA: Nramp family divalent metal transporter [Thermoleophilaceae bacterium]|nr:Nramp family divalent metal transporter [Thermoleophilaceae bacterium]